MFVIRQAKSDSLDLKQPIKALIRGCLQPTILNQFFFDTINNDDDNNSNNDNNYNNNNDIIKPDIIIKDKQEKTCMLIAMTIPSDRNTSVKVAEKLSKYKDLEIEITKMWGLKTITVPVVLGALGVVKKGIKKHIDKNYQEKLTSQNFKSSPS